jgi:hypothetical protein
MRLDVETAIGDKLLLPYGIREWNARRMLAVLHAASRHMLTMHESATSTKYGTRPVSAMAEEKEKRGRKP